MGLNSRLATVWFENHQMVIFNDSREGKTLDASELELSGVSPELAAKAAGQPDTDAYCYIKWHANNPCSPERVQMACTRPTDREVTVRAQILEEKDTAFMEELTLALSVDGKEPSAKELKQQIRFNAAAKLVEEAHQLVGLTSREARQLVERELKGLELKVELLSLQRQQEEARQELAQQEKLGASEMVRSILAREVERLTGVIAEREKDIQRFARRVGTDIYILDENEGNALAETPRIPLCLADGAEWDYDEKTNGGVVHLTHGFWRLPRPPVRPGEAPSEARHRVCRAGPRGDGTHASLVYYRTPTEQQRGIVLVVPMKLFQRMLRMKYAILAEAYND